VCACVSLGAVARVFAPVGKETVDAKNEPVRVRERERESDARWAFILYNVCV